MNEDLKHELVLMDKRCDTLQAEVLALTSRDNMFEKRLQKLQQSIDNLKKMFIVLNERSAEAKYK